MKTGFSEAAASFVSASQNARVITENWAEKYMFCPCCGADELSRFPANSPVADFYCSVCGDQYELKSQAKEFGRKVADGAYRTKIERLSSDTSPNLILLQYDRRQRQVENLRVIPKYFFTPNVVEARKPLGSKARRAGWIGSNILLERIPKSGQITIIFEGVIRDQAEVVRQWNQLRFLEKKVGEARGWLLEVMQCLERLDESEFTLADIYAFEGHLAALFPRNNNVRAKIRQQLQVLRDFGYISFTGRGHYRLK